MKQLRKGSLAVFIDCPNEKQNIGNAVSLVKRGAGPFRGAWLVQGCISHRRSAIPLEHEVRYKRAWANRGWLVPFEDGASDKAILTAMAQAIVPSFQP